MNTTTYGERMSAFVYTNMKFFGSLLSRQVDGSQLQYLRNRYYDPNTGRFTQEDPIGLAGGLNLYGFANGDPVNFSDPFGLCVPDCLIDLAFLAADIRDIRRNGLSWGRGLSLAADVAAAALPFVPAVAGAGVRAGSGALRASREAHAAQQAAAAAGRSWTTQRRAFWRAEAAAEGAAERWGAGNIDRMNRGLAPQYRDASGRLRSYELDHTPVPRRDGGTEVVPKTRQQHAQDDPFRRIGQQ